MDLAVGIISFSVGMVVGATLICERSLSFVVLK